MAFFTTGAQLQAAINALPDSKKGDFTPFDGFFYGNTYLQNYSGTLSPLEHFVQIGADRGFAPSAQFDPAYYKAAYADLKSTNFNSADLLIHFLTFGLDEGRAPNATLATFNGAAYLANNADVAAFVNANLAAFGGSASNGALAHFVKFGQFEGRTDVDTSAGITQRLAIGQDDLTGTANNDVFIARIGADSDTLQSDDFIDGAGGFDTLEVTLANTPFAITPRTNSVEALFVRSQANGDDEGTNDVQGFVSAITKNLTADNAPGAFDVNIKSTIVTAGDNTIDAQNLVGTTQFWSTNSRADLVVEDVRNNSHQTTLGFQSADPGDVDYAVFFNPANITAPGTTTEGASLTLRLADVLGLAESSNGLAGLPYTGLTINVGGTPVALTIDFAALTTYASFAAAINAALLAAGQTNITATLGVSETAVFSIPVTSAGITYAQGQLAGSYNPIILTNSGPEAVTGGSYTLATGGQEPNGNLVRTATPNETDPIPSLTQVNMILDDVGRGSMAGDFLAGSMSTGTSGSAGIAQFNVSVDRNSHITTLQTTNNWLEVVNVNNIGANGNVRIDDNNLTDADYGLTDVRVLDASTMVGNVTVSAVLSADVVAKYMDRVDVNAPAADNSDPVQYRNVVDQEFSYDLGTGNDNLYLNISNSNLAAAGTTNREDFRLVVNGGNGNDAITLQVGTGVGVGTEAWYLNSKLNANMAINGGDGNDTIRTPGAGDVIINAGAGNDTVYTDNTGTERATWVFNTADQVAATAAARVLGDLVSSTNTGYANLYKATATVTFKGIASGPIVIGSTNFGATDLQINQAIKAAINGDNVLNKLIIAQDGPANTLIVTSLIDGAQVVGALDVLFAAPAVTGLTASDLIAYNAANPAAPAADIAALQALIVTAATAVNGAADYDANFAVVGVADIDGVASASVSDNTITPGADRDVVVLGTTLGASAALSSNESVVYTAAFGADTIVNFAAAGNGIDTLNFTGLGGATGAGFVTAIGGGVLVTGSGAVSTSIIIDELVAPAALVPAAAGVNNTTAALVANLFADSGSATVAKTFVYVAVDTATNIGSVYSVADAVGGTLNATTTLAGSNVTATLMGTIDLADTSWAALTAANFA